VILLVDVALEEDHSCASNAVKGMEESVLRCGATVARCR
jgi:hypothetical protein